MFRYEIKKVFSKTSSKIAVALLAAVIALTCWFATNVSYVNEAGETETGYAAVQKLKQAQKEWVGVLDEEKLQRVIEENVRISHTPEAKSSDTTDNNIAYSQKQGILEIRSLLNYAYAEDFQFYDYYRADRLSPGEAGTFYENRTELLKDWLEDEAADRFSDAEKSYLTEQYETLHTPFYYDYMKGWTQGLEYAPTVIMILALILGFLTAGIFSNEFSWKSDAIFFTAVHGRRKAVAAKVEAGFCVITVLYWAAILLYSGVVLLYLGSDGASCPVQADFTGWKCFYHINMWQKYLLTVLGGYIGCLFIGFFTMLVSARTKSTVLAVIVPFVLIFLPSFLSSIESSAVNKLLGLMPDRLLQVNTALGFFDLYELGGRVTGAVPVLFILYGSLAAALVPVVYQVYRRSQIG